MHELYEVITSDEKEQNLIAALVRLLKNRDMEKVTASDLAREAGISRTTFYRKYDDVSDFVRKIEEKILDKVWKLCMHMISTDFSVEHFDVVDNVSLEPLKFLYSIKELYLALNSEHGDPSYRKREQELVRQLYGGRITLHNIKPEEFDFYLCYAIAGYSAVFIYWFRYRPDITPEQMCIILQQLMFSIYL